MNPITRLWCVGASVWLVLASIGRVAIQLSDNQHLDALPFVSCAIGFVGLILAFFDAAHDGKRDTND